MRIRFTKHTKYYALSLQQDLFDLFDWVVVKSYGRIGTKMGRLQTIPFKSEPEAKAYFDSECKRRIKRGYILVLSPS